MIIEINEKQVGSTAELIQTVNSSNGQEITIKYVRDGQVEETQIEPAQTGSNEYKLGLWVKEGATGVGTISFYNPETMEFAALGHGIVDSDTGELLSIEKGEITETKIVSLTKGTSRKSRRNKRNYK